MISNVNRDFHFLEKIGDYVKLWKLLVIDDVASDPVDPLPVRAGSDSGIPYEKPGDVPDGVATLEAFDKAWCIDGVTARVLGWACGGRSYVTYSSKSPKPVVSKDWLISTANGLYGIARGWDQSYDSYCSNGFCGAVESRDGKDIISRFSSWVPCGKSVSLEWNVNGRYTGEAGLPGIYDANPPSTIYGWRSLPEFQDEEDMDNSSCVNWRKMFSAMLHEYAVRDFISVATLLGKEPDDDPEHGNFAWKDSDAFLDPFPMSLDSKHVTGLYSDLERCKMFVSMFPRGSSIVSGSFSRSFSGTLVHREFDAHHPQSCGGDAYIKGSGCQSTVDDGESKPYTQDQTDRYNSESSPSSVVPSGDLCSVEALTDEILCPSWQPGGTISITDGSLALEYKAVLSHSFIQYNACNCYSNNVLSAVSMSSSPTGESTYTRESSGTMKSKGSVIVNFSSVVPSGSFVKRAYVFAISVSAKLESTVDADDEVYSSRHGTVYSFDSALKMEASGSLKLGVYAKLIECEVRDGNKIVIPPQDSASDVPDPSGEKTAILPVNGDPFNKPGASLNGVSLVYGATANSTHKRVFCYGPLVVEFDLKTLLKEDGK